MVKDDDHVKFSKPLRLFTVAKQTSPEIPFEKGSRGIGIHPFLNSGRSAKKVRKEGKLPDGIEVQSVSVAGLHAEWIISSRSEERQGNSSYDRRWICKRFMQRPSSSCRQDRRRAVESGCCFLSTGWLQSILYPAALEDSVSAYQWLLSQGVSPSRIIIVG